MNGTRDSGPEERKRLHRLTCELNDFFNEHDVSITDRANICLNLATELIVMHTDESMRESMRESWLAHCEVIYDETLVDIDGKHLEDA